MENPYRTSPAAGETQAMGFKTTAVPHEQYLWWNRIAVMASLSTMAACLQCVTLLFIIVTFTRAGREPGPDWVDVAGPILAVGYQLCALVGLVAGLSAACNLRALGTWSRVMVLVAVLVSGVLSLGIIASIVDFVRDYPA
jgi:hypothetical protein